jgi:hypothetical protein
MRAGLASLDRPPEVSGPVAAAVSYHSTDTRGHRSGPSGIPIDYGPDPPT